MKFMTYVFLSLLTHLSKTMEQWYLKCFNKHYRSIIVLSGTLELVSISSTHVAELNFFVGNEV